MIPFFLNVLNLVLITFFMDSFDFDGPTKNSLCMKILGSLMFVLLFVLIESVEFIYQPLG